MTKIIHKNDITKHGKLPAVSEKKTPVLDPLFLDTLAQLRTSPLPLESRGPLNEVKKKSANPYYKRAIAKFITYSMVLPLSDLDSPLKDAYWNTFYCCQTLLQEGKKLTGKYCNNRWCLVCNRIRTAKLINGYMQPLKDKVKQPYFITLTIPNVAGYDLRNSIQEMTKTMRKITDLFRNRRKFRIIGLRKIEVTYNSLVENFHPHIHLILNTKRAGLALISEWLDRYPEAVMDAQDIQKADERTVIELFKYFTKIATKKDGCRQDGRTIINIHAEALDVIFQAMYALRVFQPMGIKKQPISEDIEKIESQAVAELRDEIAEWLWDQKKSDWIKDRVRGQKFGDWVKGDNQQLTNNKAYSKYKVQTIKLF